MWLSLEISFFCFKAMLFTVFIVKHDSHFSSQNDLVNVRARSCCSSAPTSLMAPHFPQIKSKSPSNALPGSAQSASWQVTHVLSYSLSCLGCSWIKPGHPPQSLCTGCSLCLQFPFLRMHKAHFPSPSNLCSSEAYMAFLFKY